MSINSANIKIIGKGSNAAIAPVVRSIDAGTVTTASRLAITVTTNANAISPLKILAQKPVAAAGGDEKARTIPENNTGVNKTDPTKARSGMKIYVISNVQPNGFGSCTDSFTSFASILRYRKSISKTSKSPM
jgi:hypothetical protein